MTTSATTRTTPGSRARSPSTDRILAIMGKEWLDLRRNKTVLSALAALPILMTVMASVLFVTSSRAMAHASRTPSMKGVPAEITELTSNPGEAHIMMMVFSGLMLFSIVPVVLPSIMAAHSIVGEKQARSLEPLLATPVRTWELLMGKLIGILLPALVPSLIGYAIYVLVVWNVASETVFHFAISPAFLLTVGVVGPLAAVLAITFGIMVSSRAADLQSAQGISGLLVLPVIALGVAQLFGAVSLSVTTVVVKALVLVVIDTGMLLLSISIFERETILSRWK